MIEIGTPLTITGVIATIVSLIFACAAFYNSHRRRKHAQRMSRGPVAPPPEEVLKKHTEKLVRKLTPTPAPPPQPEPDRQVQMKSKPPETIEPPKKPSSGPLFRKLGLHGLEESAQKVDDTQYRWE